MVEVAVFTGRKDMFRRLSYYPAFPGFVRAVGSLQFVAMVMVSRGVAPPSVQPMSVAQQPNRQDFPQAPEVC